ncbi:MAG: hypothetical protein AAB388_05085 [Patescibacteria group bacterium]
MTKLFAPFTWFFSLPKGNFGKKLSGYYWRAVAFAMIALITLFSYLRENYPGKMDVLVQSKVEADAALESFLWLVSLVLTIGVWLVAAFVLSLFFQIPRMMYWLITPMSWSDRRKLVVFTKEVHQAKHDSWQKTQELRREREESANHITLSQEDSAKVRGIRKVVDAGVGASVLIGLLVSLTILGFGPSFIRENGVGPWVVFADIIETLPLHSFLLGFLAWVMLSGIIVTIGATMERNVGKRYFWVNGVENRLKLT